MEREKLPGHDPDLAGHRRGARRHQGVFRPRRVVQGRRRRAVHARATATSACRGATRDGTGLVSVQYTFRGETAHAAGAPWRGRSALDAVELMDIGWNFRREHLPLEQRSHYVITDGGDQPNVVPRTASVWYYFRQTTYPKIKEMWEIGDHDREGRGDDDRHRAAADAGARHPPGRSTSTRPSPRRPTPTSRRSACRSGATRTRRSPRRCRRSSASREQRALTTKVAAELQGPVDDNTRRRLRRHRRHLVERADGHAALSRRTFPACPATTGRTRSRWRRRSRTRARPPAPRCRR